MVLNPELHSSGNLLHVYSLPSAFKQPNIQVLLISDNVLNTVMNYFCLFSVMCLLIPSFRQVTVTGLIYSDA